MQLEKIVNNVKNYIDKVSTHQFNVQIFQKPDTYQQYFKNCGIDVALNHNKAIILREETILELGGHHKFSYSLVIPLSNENVLIDGNVNVIGPSIAELRQKEVSQVDFGMLLFIQIDKKADLQAKKFKYFNFFGDGIEGFLIRTIPRRFWCRISSQIIDQFSFEFLGHAINYLYKQKFPNELKASEVFLINSHPDLLNKLKQFTSEFLEHDKKHWESKVERWKEKVGCDYDWGCSICPDRAECYDIKKVLLERERLQE
ncbi:MAG: hypothetical protein ACOC35_05905 [Promethearchaeia archaeon]